MRLKGQGTGRTCALRGFALAGLTLLAGPALSLAATFTCNTAAEFTAALTNSALGDTINLTAGNTFTGSFTLPNKTTGTGYLTIQSSQMASLPVAGRRVFPANAPNMP